MAESERVKEARRRYQREYRKKNPDKVRKWQENFWVKYEEKTKAPEEPDLLESLKNDSEEKKSDQ